MSDTMILLQLEHTNIARLLAVLDHQCQAIDGGALPDRELLGSVLEYFREYPDQCHHPKEDLVFRKLSERDPDAAAALGDLLGDHEELAALTERTSRLVDAATRARDGGKGSEDIAGAVDERPGVTELVDGLRRFVSAYRHHLMAEDEHFFPAVADRLTREDWALIDFAVFEREDPLYDVTNESRFVALRKAIWESVPQSLSPEEVAELLELASVEAFNETMETGQREIRLVRDEVGGYGLKRGGQLIARIPECDEKRAVWCACYLLKGMAT